MISLVCFEVNFITEFYKLKDGLKDKLNFNCPDIIVSIVLPLAVEKFLENNYHISSGYTKEVVFFPF